MAMRSSSFGGTRRNRRRRTAWAAARWTLLAASLLGGALASYRVGISQGRVEVERLKGDLAAMREVNRATGERAAHAEQQAEAAIARHARLQQAYRDRPPSGELRELVDLVGERLRAGVPASRVGFVLRGTTVERRCDQELDTKRVVVHTPANSGAIGAVTFADDRITVTGEGAAARAADGAPESRFDPAQPVALRFLEIDGDVGTARGVLPLTHAVVLGSEEFQFSVRPSEKQPGSLEVTALRCDFP